MMTVTRRTEDRVLLLDTSAAIALLVADHEFHAAVVRAAADRQLGLAGHAWFETFSVVTRLPPDRRRSPAQAAHLLHANFPRSTFLTADAAAELATELGRRGIAGGQVYDALVACAARAAGLPMLSIDVRARPTYEALGVKVELLDATPGGQ